ncbi:hypothetical protein ACHQM5_029003 [Ranunculus cassubicifolius]
MRKDSSNFYRMGFILLYSASCFFIWTEAQTASVTEKTTVNVGVILDMDTWIGKMCHSCMSIAVADFYGDSINHQYRTKLALHIRNAKCMTSALFAAKDLLETESVQVIVGPQKAGQSEIVAELGNEVLVPVVSFSATSPSVPRSYFPYWIHMTQKDTYQLQAIASIVTNFGWKEVVLIYEETDYRNEMIPSFIKTLEAMNIHVGYRSVIPPSATEHQILEELHKLMEIPVRVFIVHLSPSVGPQFFRKVKELGLMNEDSVWIITEGLTNLLRSMDHSVIFAMHGVIGVTPYIPPSEKLDKIRTRITRRIVEEGGTYGDINIMCLHAYDTMWALAMAAERTFVNSTGNPIKDTAFADIGDFGIADMGPGILKEILESNFIGLSGEINLVDGHLKPLVLQIINIIGRQEREIGFWVPTVGISQTPNGSEQTHLLPVIWPGSTEPTVVPKGWIMSPSMRKLKIGYLTKDAYSGFVEVSGDGKFVTGYCIDVFKTVVEALPYVLPYEFVPLQKADDETEGSYNELVDQVFYKKYDAAVGDITITANRSLFVDFTLPYTLGGVSMLVPIRYEEKSNFVILYEDLSWSIWLIHLLLCLLIFVLSYFQFRHDRVRGVRFVQNTGITGMIASLLSIFNGIDNRKKWATLCVQIYVIAYFVTFLQALVALFANGNSQLATVDAKDLVRRGDFVGYQNGSFVQKLLKELNFDDSNIKVYDSREEYHEALEKGSENGGVSAIFDEIPYIEAILEKNCGKYRRVGPIHQMKGFGFVFPRGSSYVPDFSRAVSSVVEGEKILQIEKKWSKRTCQDPLETKPSIFLSINTIRLLFFFIIPIFAYGVLAATPVDVNVDIEVTPPPSPSPPRDVNIPPEADRLSDATNILDREISELSAQLMADNFEIVVRIHPMAGTSEGSQGIDSTGSSCTEAEPRRKTWSEILCPCMQEKSREPADCANSIREKTDATRM